MNYHRINITPESPQESSLIQMCADHFGREAPYSRRLPLSFFAGTKEALRNGTVCVAVTGNQLMGLCVVCAPQYDPRIVRYVPSDKSALYLEALIVLPAYRRQGHGKSLLQKTLEDHCGSVLLLITPEQHTAARAFYEKLGMTTVDAFDQQERHYQTGEPFNLRRLVMRGDIVQMLTPH